MDILWDGLFLTFSFSGFAFGLVDSFDLLANLVSFGVDIFLYAGLGVFASGNGSSSWSRDFGHLRTSSRSSVDLISS